ncbi:MAG: phosphatase PAP2 family protein [Woeseiaceae bacterium]
MPHSRLRFIWPLKHALLAGVLVTAAVVWSRLVLGRHVVADVIAGALLGRSRAPRIKCGSSNNAFRAGNFGLVAAIVSS